MSNPNTRITVNLTSFDPKSYANKDLETLEEWLDELEDLAEKRQHLYDTLFIDELFNWMDNPERKTKLSYHFPLWEAIPDDRVEAFVNDKMKQYEDNNRYLSCLRRLQNLSLSDQRWAISFAKYRSHKNAGTKQNKNYEANLSHLYHKIIENFPDIILNEADLLGMIKFSQIIKEQRQNLYQKWIAGSENDTDNQTSKSLLAQAYRDDKTLDHMRLQFRSAHGIGGVYTGNMITDTLVVVPDILFFRNAGVLTHEYHHRRQCALAEKLAQGKLEEQSADWYTARLYRANIKGGYISSRRSRSAYRSLPVELSSRFHESLLSVTATISLPIKWRVPCALSKTFSQTVKPNDIIETYDVKNYLASLQTANQNRPVSFKNKFGIRYEC